MFNLLRPKGRVPAHSEYLSPEEIAALPMFEDGNNGIRLLFTVPVPNSRHKKKYLHYTGKGNIVVVAPSRSGKGVSVFIPAALTWEKALIGYEMKGELLEISCRWRNSIGPVYRIWPHVEVQEEIRTLSSLTYCKNVTFNPLDAVRWGTDDAEEDLRIFTESLSRTGRNGHIEKKAAKIIADEAKNIRLARGSLSLSVIAKNIEKQADKRYEERRNFQRSVDYTFEKELEFQEVDRSFEHARRTLKIFHDPVIAEITEKTTFNLNTFAETCSTAFFVSSYHRNPTHDGLMRAGLEILMRRVASKKHETLVLLPECYGKGLIEAEESIKTLLARGITLISSFNDIQQVHEAYTKNSRFLDLADLIIMLPPFYNDKTKNWISKKIGTTPVKVTKVTSLGEKLEYFKEHPIVTPAETNNIKQGSVLLFPKERKPILADVIPYYLDHGLRKRYE